MRHRSRQATAQTIKGLKDAGYLIGELGEYILKPIPLTIENIKSAFTPHHSILSRAGLNTQDELTGATAKDFEDAMPKELTEEQKKNLEVGTPGEMRYNYFHDTKGGEDIYIGKTPSLAELEEEKKAKRCPVPKDGDDE